ncbi:MAG: CoA transferase [Pseudomonadota bacterium]
MTTLASPSPTLPQVLSGVRVLSLALNLPGPAALMRCHQMGARCTKLEPPAGDAMRLYSPACYEAVGAGVTVLSVDLKTEAGQQVLHHQLAHHDVLLTSFRPSALLKLGLAWDALHARHPQLSHVAIVGAPGAQAEEPGHDLTYLAENGLVTGLELPATLFADMGGSLLASEAVLQAVMHLRVHEYGTRIEVALSSAAHYMALPREWGLTEPGAILGGAHAGYRIYACLDGRVAVAALEPHFARRLAEAAGLDATRADLLLDPVSHQRLAEFLAQRTRQQLDQLAKDKDIPLHTLAS